MTIINNILAFFKKPQSETKDEAPEGVCALCWGFQEYDGKLRKLFKDKQVDVNNHKDSFMLVQRFVREHVDGYHIKEGLVHVCPNCSALEDDKEKITKFDPAALEES
ncbi:hypothetical protein ES711_02200 [Gelidibacter salicanalis]|uniref:Uncharacterized protein n=1 Tax=Gelidibacter salicanalis TaxID=291193 RepID=A0A5C7AQX4_9FLAO|nr:hypothetical protein [Gelidibacter salicanalis]TXE10741.1 hypothetical protein ES711_02200 [Gelidibacter salicanalis]